jgi:7,8-dihydropterin-6-yl-methyl-4-(beta-D-ribofuranosyl)aminobenzene 5'-phosphate synthase
MCAELGDPRQAALAAPRPAPGPGVDDPITLQPVDQVELTILVDNFYDALLAGDERTRRAPFGLGRAAAAQFEGGVTAPGLFAEHGFAALVTVRRAAATTRLLFDTGLSPQAMVSNADRLGIDLSDIHAVVLSQGHADHTGWPDSRAGVASMPCRWWCTRGCGLADGSPCPARTPSSCLR